MGLAPKQESREHQSVEADELGISEVATSKPEQQQATKVMHKQLKPSGKHESVLATYLMRIMNSVILLSALAGIGVLARSRGAEVLNFSFNWYAIVYAVTIVALAAFLVPLSSKRNRNRVTFWFSVSVWLGILLMISGLMSCISADHATYDFWYHAFAFVVPLSVPFLFFMVLALTDNEKLLYRPLNWLIIFGGSMTIFYLDITTKFFNDTSLVVRGSWGYSPFPINGNYYNMVYLPWVQSFLIATVILLVHHYKKVRKNPRKRKQTLLVVLGSIETSIVPTISIFVVPVIFHIKLPPTVPLASLLQVCLIGYAILRYKVFAIEPAALSDTVLGTMNESVITINSYHEIEHLNPNAASMLNVSDQHVRGQHLDKVFSSETAKLLLQKLKDGSTDAFELDLPTDKGVTPISLLMSAITDDSGTAAGYILVFRDITKERTAKTEIERQVVERTEQVHEEQIKLKASIDSLSLGFVMIDANDKVLLSNEAVNQILGKASAEWTLPQLAGMLGEEFDFEAACIEVRTSKQKKYVPKISFGAKILRIFLSPVAYRADAIGIVVLFEDVTEQEVMNRSKDEFFSIASHELRTPLTAIRGNASMIMDFFADQMKDKQLHEMVEDIHGSSTRLIDIVNDFLDVSRLEQGKVTYSYEEVPIDEIIETVIYEMKAMLQEKHLSLDFNHKTLGVLPKIWTDRNRLKQVIYNMVGNAAKFTEKGGISIDAKVEGPLLKVLVIDTGRGISVEGQKLLFHKFQQAGSSLLTRDTTRGTGLGLYISKMMVENMGGTIALEHSEEGTGSTFSFTMPIATEALKQSQEHTKIDSATGLTVADTDVTPAKSGRQKPHLQPQPSLG